jgi:hypothetical protein
LADLETLVAASAEADRLVVAEATDSLCETLFLAFVHQAVADAVNLQTAVVVALIVSLYETLFLGSGQVQAVVVVVNLQIAVAAVQLAAC